MYRSHEVAALIDELRGGCSAPANSAPLVFMDELGARAMAYLKVFRIPKDEVTT